MAMADGTKTGGRAKGTENRTTREIRDHFASFLHYASPEIVTLWKKLAEESPKDALDAINKFADFVLPKLARVEKQNLDENGNPAKDPVGAILEYVANQKEKERTNGE